MEIDGVYNREDDTFTFTFDDQSLTLTYEDFECLSIEMQFTLTERAMGGRTDAVALL